MISQETLSKLSRQQLAALYKAVGDELLKRNKEHGLAMRKAIKAGHTMFTFWSAKREQTITCRVTGATSKYIRVDEVNEKMEVVGKWRVPPHMLEIHAHRTPTGVSVPEF